MIPVVDSTLIDSCGSKEVPYFMRNQCLLEIGDSCYPEVVLGFPNNCFGNLYPPVHR